jgi:hypothetical protein
MLKNFIKNLSEGPYGVTVKEFAPASLCQKDRSKISFIVNEKSGEKQLVLVLSVDEGHEIEREFCNVDVECLKNLKILIEDVEKFFSANTMITSSQAVTRE